MEKITKKIFGVMTNEPSITKVKSFNSMDEAKIYSEILKEKVKNSWAPKAKVIIQKGEYRIGNTGKYFAWTKEES